MEISMVPSLRQISAKLPRDQPITLVLDGCGYWALARREEVAIRL